MWLCVWREKGGEEEEEEVGSGPLLLPWRPHPDAAAAEGASGRSEPVCSSEERRRAEEPPIHRHCLPHLKPVAAPGALWVRG